MDQYSHTQSHLWRESMQQRWHNQHIASDPLGVAKAANDEPHREESKGHCPAKSWLYAANLSPHQDAQRELALQSKL